MTRNLSLRNRQAILVILDMLLIILSYILAFAIRFDFQFTTEPGGTDAWFVFLNAMILIICVKLAAFFVMGLYRSLWRYASMQEMLQIILAVILANTATITLMTLTGRTLPRSVMVLVIVLDMALIGGMRFTYRLLRSTMQGNRLNFKRLFKRHLFVRNLMIVGAGEAAAAIIRELQGLHYRQGRPVALVDDDPAKQGQRLMGVPVLGPLRSMNSLAEERGIDEIIVAIPSASRREMRHIVEQATATGKKVRIIPGIYELLDGQVSVKDIRDVAIEDLLGREPVCVDLAAMAAYLENKVVLVTGGGGSIGSELCRQIASFNPKQLVMMDIYENHLYDLHQELKRTHPTIDLVPVISSVRDRPQLNRLFSHHKPQVVFHAAAHKHVPLMELTPEEAVKNNVLGTRNMAEYAHRFGAERFVMISTDKAVNPTSIMGASKRLAEMLVQSLDEISQTRFVSVRFGNVLGSSGSVVPLFQRQIAAGGPVNVTHEEMTRFFMTIPEASQLVIQAGALARGGEVFVLDMGEPVKIMDLAKNLIRLSGFAPGIEIPIQITGLRPGEKLFEELLLDSSGLEGTAHQKIFVEHPPASDWSMLNLQVQALYDKLHHLDANDIKDEVCRLVGTYKPRYYGLPEWEEEESGQENSGSNLSEKIHDS
ncbi:MAG: nucleoside-diphosphate sugar epimerase/dehydratase [Bacillota bacterium]|nr:nucleoside-diphosphate sugar epimerase/dehydratase [Bacillota bacterium]MDW7676556.1 nucleoside-diphosphate sugar epimerase/dehydratase [Bacillota bacterium]